MLGSGYERNAVWCMRKATFFTSFYPLMNKSKNNLIEFANGRYYVMGNEVYFTASVPANEAYLGDFGYIIGNYSQDITVTSSDVSGSATTASTISPRACSTLSPRLASALSYTSPKRARKGAA